MNKSVRTVRHNLIKVCGVLSFRLEVAYDKVALCVITWHDNTEFSNLLPAVTGLTR